MCSLAFRKKLLVSTKCYKGKYLGQSGYETFIFPKYLRNIV